MAIAVLSDKANAIIQAVKKSNDSLDLVGGTDLVSFLTETKERNEFFERILVIDTAVTKGNEHDDFLFLKQYIEKYAPSMEVVLGIPRDRGSQLADLFLSEFSAPMYTVAYLPKQTSIQILKDLVTLPVLELKAKYFSLDSADVKANEAKKKEKPAKKGGFFSKLFGGGKGKHDVAEEEVEKEVQETVTPQVEVAVTPPTMPPVTPTPVDVVAESVVGATVVGATVGAEGVSQASEELQNNINALFGGTTTSSVEEGEAENDSLLFGNFGEMHLQTGFIDEEGEDDFDAIVEDDAPDTGWGSVESTPASDFAPVSENTGSADFTPFSPVSETAFSSEEVAGSSSSEIFGGMSNENSSNLIGFGVTLVVGGTSSKFLAETASVESGLVILDTKSTVGMATYIDERAYLENEDDGYLENGNTYYMGVGTNELNTLISRHYGDKVVVNVSVSDLDRVCASINSEYSILAVFDEDLPAFENQLLEFESIQPVTAREVQKGSAFTVGGMSSKKQEVLEYGVFSRINWKGLFK
jgi:hypothetical protein